MKKKIIICTVILIVLVLIFLIIKNYKKYKDYSIIEIKDNLDIEFGNIYYLSDFISIKNSKLIDKKIQYTNIGKYEIKYYYKNEYGIKFNKSITLNVVDTTKPVVMLNSSYTINVGSDTDLSKSIICADNYDNNPNCYIEGDYDINKVGSYPLTYVAKDKNNNETKIEFNLNIVNKNSNINSTITKTYFSDVVNKYKNNNTKIGIDVSKWQGEIDWDKVVSSGVEFVMIRIGAQDGFDGDYYLDKYFLKNIKGATDKGIDIGLYFYSFATDSKEAIKQANWIINNIKDYKIVLPVVFDWECWKYFNTLNISLFDITKVQESFLDTITSKGYSGARYGSKTYLSKMWLESDYPTWLAHYTKETDYDKEYFMWQLCSDGVIEGIDGFVDINVLYVNQK